MPKYDITKPGAAEQLKRDLKGAMEDVVEHELISRASEVRCPVHGTAPSNLRASIVLDGQGDLLFEACCEALRDAVHAALQGDDDDGHDGALGGDDD